MQITYGLQHGDLASGLRAFIVCFDCTTDQDSLGRLLEEPAEH